MPVQPDRGYGRAVKKGGSAMARVARKCTKCEAVDMRRTWASNEEAVQQDALERWTCPSCAWLEAELVEAEAEPARS